MKFLFCFLCLLLFALNAMAETMVVNFDDQIAEEADQAIDLRQEQEAPPETVNIYDEYVYDFDPSNADQTSESFTN